MFPNLSAFKIQLLFDKPPEDVKSESLDYFEQLAQKHLDEIYKRVDRSKPLTDEDVEQINQNKWNYDVLLAFYEYSYGSSSSYFSKCDEIVSLEDRHRAESVLSSSPYYTNPLEQYKEVYL